MNHFRALLKYPKLESDQLIRFNVIHSTHFKSGSSSPAGVGVLSDPVTLFVYGGATHVDCIEQE